MKNLLKVTSVVSFALVLAATGEPIEGTFTMFQLALAFGSLIVLIGSVLTLVRISKNEYNAEWSAKERSRQTEMVSTELALLAGNGNKLAGKLK